jgi:hypothetical protein
MQASSSIAYMSGLLSPTESPADGDARASRTCSLMVPGACNAQLGMNAALDDGNIAPVVTGDSGLVTRHFL